MIDVESMAVAYVCKIAILYFKTPQLKGIKVKKKS